MTSSNANVDSSLGRTCSDLSSSQLSCSLDCSSFLNWSEDADDTVEEKAVVFGSLVATLKLQPALDEYLETKAVKFLKSVDAKDSESADAFLGNLASISGDSSPDFVQSILVLLSTPSQVIATATMEMLSELFEWCSATVHFPLVKSDLIPQLISLLNPLSLSFAEAVDIHTYLISIISYSIWLATPLGLKQLETEDDDEDQAVHEMVLKQVLLPSEKDICHLCVNRFSILDGVQSERFLKLLARLLQISPVYQPTMDFVLHMPIFLTVPRSLTFFENEPAIWGFLFHMNNAQRKWNEERGVVNQMVKKVHRMLRMEGIDDGFC
ncbi:hypothetical protein BLNAU_14571 [Blattamonas nauphoetae]|uniref:Uncharacterized protein n=1 Tax=Blattamonas nauphoetae TaxID=2049346 RepID=A0ABQ9XD92_9EUKA|nr:hypothetical protein BLNAU_14571 [Blattamonas nauphoetae]